MNLVSLAMQFLAPVIVGKLASSFGLNPSMAQKIVSVVVPAILAGVVGRVSQPGGAKALTDVLGQQDPGLLGGLADIIGGPRQAAIADQGSNVLGSLLGTSTLGSLVGAAAKFSGVGEGPTKGLVGLLAPAVLGTIAQQQKASGLDASGLATLLMGQKENIQAAIPGDFAKLLGGTGLLDGVMPAAAAATVAAGAASMAKAATTTATSAASSAASTVTATASGATEAMRDAAPKSSFGWWPWLALIGAAGVAWFYLFAQPRPSAISLPTPPSITVGGANIGSQLGGVLGTLQTSLGSIKDVASANSALPKLRETSTEIDRLAGVVKGLGGDNRRSIASYMAVALPLLKPAIDSLLANSSLAPVLKPVLDSMLGKLTEMSRT